MITASCEPFLSFLHPQTIWNHQKIYQSHGEDAVLVSPWLDVIFYDDNLLERIVNP